MVEFVCGSGREKEGDWRKVYCVSSNLFERIDANDRVCFLHPRTSNQPKNQRAALGWRSKALA